MDIKINLKYYQQKFDAKIFELQNLPQYYNDENIGKQSLEDINRFGIYCQSECYISANYIKFCLFFEDNKLLSKPIYPKNNLLKNNLPILKGTVMFILADSDDNEIDYSIYSCLDLSKEELEKCFYIL